MQKKLPNHCGRWSASLHALATGALTFTLFTRAYGLSVIVAPPTFPPEPKTASAAGDTTGSDTNQVDEAGGTVAGSGTGGLQNRNPFQWGPILLHPHIGYGLSYGNGLHYQPGQTAKSLINNVSAGLGLDLGKHWDLGYTAAASLYSDKNFKDNVDHSITLHGHTTYEDWNFNLSQSVALTSDPLVETARQTDQQSYSTVLVLNDQINGELSGSITAGQQISASSAPGWTNSVGSSTDWTLSGSLNYQLGPGLSAGASLGWGYSRVAIGPDNTYENLNLNLNWAFARKLSLSLNGGAQIRQFIGFGLPALISPTFGVTLGYHPFEFTMINLSASRSIGDSFFKNQVTENTSVNLGLSQRLFKNYSVSMNGSYGLTRYLDSAPGGASGNSGRSDTQASFSVSLNRSFLKHGTASLSYSKSHNGSSDGKFTYNSDQAGLSLTYGY